MLNVIQQITADEGVADEIGPMPLQLIDSYVNVAMLRASTEGMESGRWFAQILLLGDVWAEGDTEAAALDDLREVTREWVTMKIEDRDRDIPVIGMLDLNRI